MNCFVNADVILINGSLTNERERKSESRGRERQTDRQIDRQRQR